MRRFFLLPLIGLAWGAACRPGVSSIRADSPEERAWAEYSQAIESINCDHAGNPGKTREPELARRLPEDARTAFDTLLTLQLDRSVQCAVFSSALAALELDLQEDYSRARQRLVTSASGFGEMLGEALSRPGYMLLGAGVTRGYLEHFADVVDAVLASYDELFGFEEWSKVPGKKLRIRVNLVDAIVRPPHFDPRPKYHSEIVFYVVDPEKFVSPTDDGKFLLYGLAHELGHAIALWGGPSREEDHHAWAHYTGDAVVDHLSRRKDLPFMARVDDVEWRSLARERTRLKDRRASRRDHDGVFRLLIDLHDRLGPKRIGTAINRMAREGRSRWIDGVRYYDFRSFQEALAATVEDPDLRNFVRTAFP